MTVSVSSFAGGESVSADGRSGSIPGPVAVPVDVVPAPVDGVAVVAPVVEVASLPPPPTVPVDRVSLSPADGVAPEHPQAIRASANTFTGGTGGFDGIARTVSRSPRSPVHEGPQRRTDRTSTGQALLARRANTSIRDDRWRTSAPAQREDRPDALARPPACAVSTTTLLVPPQQIEDLAQDPTAIERASKLARANHWTGLGRSERALWGECQGSKLYQVRVDRSDLACACSCPVRRTPCKHGLALLLLAAHEPITLLRSPEPEWVVDWLERRTAAAKARATTATSPKRVVNTAAQAKRAALRAERVAEGMDQLDRWLSDLVRVGLASLEESSPGVFEDQARRLVDAQAPGLAAWVRRLADRPLATPDWPKRLLDELGRIALLLRAYRRRDALPPDLLSDLRQLIGWKVSKDEVLSEGQRLQDRWRVIAQEVRADDRVRTQRTWLIGQKIGSKALVLSFAVGARQSFAEPLHLGEEFDALLAYYPGAARQRALIVQREGLPEQLTTLAGGQSVADLREEVSRALARQPWIARFGAVLSGVAPALDSDATLHLVEASGDSVPAKDVDPYLLLALSGGAPIDIGGEWDGEAFRPSLTAIDGRAHRLRPTQESHRVAARRPR